MRVETYLKQGYLLDQRINYDLQKLTEMRKAACGLPGVAIRRDKVQTSPTGDAPFVQALMRVEEMEAKINREIDQLVALKEQIREVIQQVDSNELQMILMYKYLDGMSYEEIGEKLHSERTAVFRRHKKAIEQIRLPDDPIIITKH